MAEAKESPFTFDVWQCPSCQWAMSDEERNALIGNPKCPNCGSTYVSGFTLRRTRQVNPKFKEFRKDGWPYCPNCEEDELYSYLMLGWTHDEPPPLQDCIDSGMKCYRCGWESLGRNVFGGKCWKCHKFFSRPTGEKDYVYCCACRKLVREETERKRIHAEVEAMYWPDVVY